MIDFELSEEEVLLQDLAAKFTKNEILPVAARYDHEGTFPEEIYKKMYEAGLLNLNIPSRYGGTGLSLLDQCIVIEEMSTGCAGMTTTVAANCLALQPIVIAGTEEQKNKFLNDFTSEYKLASFCLTEPGAGSDAGNLSLSVKRDGDHYILNGTKMFISNAPKASLFTVFGTMDKSLRHKGIVAFVVTRDAEGLTIGKEENKLGHRASATSEVIFDNVRIPADNRLGAEGDGFKIAMRTLDTTRPTIAAMATGVGRAALQYAASYATKRYAFNQPISSFEAIQFKIADIQKEISASRLLTWHAAWLIDKGKKATMESSIAKTFATDAAMHASIEAIQIYGGYGYSKEYPVEKLMRDAKLLQIYEGPNEIQRIVIAKEYLSEYQ
jgi:acyl-CoA dehydrogenase